jgi:hypothetical protein
MKSQEKMIIFFSLFQLFWEQTLCQQPPIRAPAMAPRNKPRIHKALWHFWYFDTKENELLVEPLCTSDSEHG